MPEKRRHQHDKERLILAVAQKRQRPQGRQGAILERVSQLLQSLPLVLVLDLAVSARGARRVEKVLQGEPSREQDARPESFLGCLPRCPTGGLIPSGRP
jgi:hypothetical protein